MILHIDMDAFFAAIEQRDNPHLQRKPIIVGGRSKRSVVTTASYEARVFGVRSAMPMFRALALCPQAIVVPGRMARYREVSERIIQVLENFSPLVEQVSIDEAFVDLQGSEKIFGTPETIAGEIKRGIRSAVGLSCSIGLAPLKFLAKIASDLQKPDGLTCISYDEMMTFIERLPLEKVPGVGPKALIRLRSLGLKTLGDVKAISEKKILEKFGKYGVRLIELANGVDESTVEPERPAKSIGAEHTLAQNTRDLSELKKYLLLQSERIGQSLRRHAMRAKTITIKIKYSDFKQVTRSETFDKPVQSSAAIYDAAVQLLSGLSLQAPVRLIGVGASFLVPEKIPMQQSLFDPAGRQTGKWEQVDRTVDRIVEKFGQDVIRKASLDDLI